MRKTIDAVILQTAFLDVDMFDEVEQLYPIIKRAGYSWDYRQHLWLLTGPPVALDDAGPLLPPTGTVMAPYAELRSVQCRDGYFRLADRDGRIYDRKPDALYGMHSQRYGINEKVARRALDGVRSFSQADLHSALRSMGWSATGSLWERRLNREMLAIYLADMVDDPDSVTDADLQLLEKDLVSRPVVSGPQGIAVIQALERDRDGTVLAVLTPGFDGAAYQLRTLDMLALY